MRRPPAFAPSRRFGRPPSRSGAREPGRREQERVGHFLVRALSTEVGAELLVRVVECLGVACGEQQAAVLGQGGDSEVVQAIDRRHDRLVALKVRRLAPDEAREPFIFMNAAGVQRDVGERAHARALAGFIPDCIVLVTRLLRDPRVPRRHKLLLGALVGYLAFDATLVFALWAGEEQGLFGSQAYVREEARRAGHEAVAVHHRERHAHRDRWQRLRRRIRRQREIEPRAVADHRAAFTVAIGGRILALHPRAGKARQQPEQALVGLHVVVALRR
jgi:hypothetical protein